MRYLFLILFCFSLSCSSGKDTSEGTGKPEIPTDIDGPEEKKDKSIQMWIDAHANLSRFASKSNIKLYLEKMKETGFNEVYVDVKPGIGHALYQSDILPKLTKWGDELVERDWDYLAYWIEEGERNGIRVIASISTLGFGAVKSKEGVIYQDSKWDGKTQMEMLENNPDKIVDIRNQSKVDAAMLNPCLPEVQTFVVSIVEEIVTKYPKLKGICLDYCRWYGANYGFGDATISAFEEYSGLKVASKNEIITASGGIGPKYKEWIEFRSMSITNLISNIRNKAKQINPKIEFHVWASADWASRFGVGQNWASKKYTPTGIRYTDAYNKTGFADLMDVFSLGAYADVVWKKDNPNSVWSVENFVTTYSDFTKGDCKVNGSLGTYAYGNRAKDLSDAVYLCLKNTDGVMVFEIGHVINNNQWGAIKEGIERVFKK